MRIVVEEIDGAYYADAILTDHDVIRIREGEMVTADVTFKRRRCYAGIRLQGEWDHYEEKDG